MASMSSRNHAMGITFQEGKGYKKCVGWYQHADGRKLPKIHWLGHDPQNAMYLATMYQQVWSAIELRGGGWTPEDIAKVKQWVTECGDLVRDVLKSVDKEEKELQFRRDGMLLVGAQFLPIASIANKTIDATPSSAEAVTEPKQGVLLTRGK
jgi:hypothetical protein